MQRLPGLPTTPDFVLLDRRKSKPLSWPHITPPLKTALYQMVLHRPFEPARLTRHSFPKLDMEANG